MSSRELVDRAMRQERTERAPVMCQLANGHVILQTGVHPIDYFTDDDLWADCLLRIREQYGFDGILCHKPGRVKGLLERATRVDRDAPTPTLYFDDGARIECTRDDDAYYKAAPGFAYPTIDEIDPEDPLGWAPQTFLDFQASKATYDIVDPDAFEDHHFGLLDRVLAKAGAEYSVHGEVRSPFDHFLNLLGMEDGLMATLDNPEKCQQLLSRTCDWSIALAVAQVRRGAHAIKVSSPFAGNAFLSREMYVDLILPHESRLAAAVRAEGAAIYTHTCGAIGDRLDLLCASGVSGIECLDPPPLGDVDIDEAVKLLRGKIFIKGNVDPVNTLLRGKPETLEREIRHVLEAARDFEGFILSSACSVAPPTPADNLKRMVEIAHAFAG